jgi:hypothetical protein
MKCEFSNLCSPNEDFGRPDKPFRLFFRITFQGCEYLIWATKRRKVLRKHSLKGLSGLPKSSFGRCRIDCSMVRGPNRVLTPLKSASKIRISFYAPQTKILEGRTNLSECFFEAIFNDS